MSSDALIPAPQVPALAEARERAIRLLTDRYADDTLSTAEFESRLDLLYGTGTPNAVAALVADLETPAAGPATGAATRPVPAAPAPAWAPAPPADERLLCVFGERRLGGRWSPGARMEIVAAFGEVTIDLREATLPPQCELEVQAFFASVRLLLPPHVELDQNVSAVMGSVDQDVPPATGSWGPRIRLRGMSALAEVAIRRAPAHLPSDAPFKLAWKEARRAAKRAASC